MDHELWKQIVWAVRSADRRVPRAGRSPVFSDQQILKMYIWAVWHERPLCWACHREHYTTLFRPKQLPSVSQFCRRIQHPRLARMLLEVHHRLGQSHRPAMLSFFDGKPLPVSRSTRDRDAKKGYADGSFQRGYKLHAWAAEDGRILRFCVRSLNEGEPNTARELLQGVHGIRQVLADANYDSAPLYAAVDQCGGELLTPLKGQATSERSLRYMPAARRRAIQLWQESPMKCRRLLDKRDQIERIFSALCGFGGGLSPLPSWVRTLPRVQRWVTAKVIIYHARLLIKQAV